MAQQLIHNPDLEKQRIAMKELTFLTGTWSGEAHVQRGARRAGDFDANRRGSI